MKKIFVYLCLASFLGAVGLEAADKPFSPVKRHVITVKKKKKNHRHAPAQLRHQHQKHRVPLKRA